MQRNIQLHRGRVVAALGAALTAGLLAACESTTPPTSPAANPTARQPKATADITLPGCNFDTCTSPPRILFTNSKDGNAEIYSMNATGSDQKRLTFDVATDNFASWSPDGTKIAFHRTWDKRRYQIMIMNADGSNLHSLRDLPNVDDAQPAWSPDGTRIAFKSNAADPAYGGYDIWTTRVDGGDPVRITTTLNARQPAYSPTGTKIAFAQGLYGTLSRGIYLTSAFGGGTPTLITTSVGYDESPTFRPDGKRIAFASTRAWGGMTPSKWSIWTTDLDGKYASVPSQSIFVDNTSPSWGVH